MILPVLPCESSFWSFYFVLSVGGMTNDGVLCAWVPTVCLVMLCTQLPVGNFTPWEWEAIRSQGTHWHSLQFLSQGLVDSVRSDLHMHYTQESLFC